MKKIFILLILLSVHFVAFSQVTGDEDKEMFNQSKARDQKAIDDAVNTWWTASMKTHEQRIQWWRDAKFGMFVHWGIYSLPAGEWKGKKVGGYAEHLMRKEKITKKDYLEVAHQFNPVLFNADKWILDAKKAGMNYFIITAKHHDGFAMYDSKVSDFNIMAQTPFKRDPMAELAAAAKKHGMKFGFYYSHAFDWEHPDAPGNDWEYKNPGGDLGLYGGVNWYAEHPELLAKAVKYVDEKAIPQIKELLTKYHPDILWFDTPQKLPLSENIRILKAIRETDPNVVVNGRLVRNANANFGDYKNTADRPAEFYPVEGDWEAIPTTNESYGYSKYDDSHKSPGFFIQLLAKAASRNGNLLLNIGPKGDGSFDTKDSKILSGIEQWVTKNSEGIYKTHKTTLPLQSWGVTTQSDNKLYLHVFNWPKDGKLYVGGLKSKLDNAYFLTDSKKTKLSIQAIGDGDFYINLPKNAPDTANTVIVLPLNGQLKTDNTRYVSANIPLTRLLAFDATLSKGFKFGDGKTDRFYVEGWEKKEQEVKWDFRTTSPQKFKIVIKYLASKEAGGSYTFKIDQQEIKQNVQIGDAKVVTQTISEIQLAKGTHHITINPTTILKTELMKLLEVQLIPLN
ncbi:alpha-L-fucosidase [Pedobacter sp. LMG 31464]|uniref:alpha-L-fucosidase n=1 Tax=Pedobacter planticolens TaxID=2679964 RepID=A0A923DZ58_9SPHI|nr:alpha-L-fucosidase [Pedobacter planticolens]MBB2145128.1 alpha-L-fucosidase [Pedobacter planticolens]